MGLAKSGEFPPEMNVTFSGIEAPRFGRGKTGKDDVRAIWHTSAGTHLHTALLCDCANSCIF